MFIPGSTSDNLVRLPFVYGTHSWPVVDSICIPELTLLSLLNQKKMHLQCSLSLRRLLCKVAVQFARRNGY